MIAVSARFRADFDGFRAEAVIMVVGPPSVAPRAGGRHRTMRGATEGLVGVHTDRV
jgi:hypothetical protein